MNGRRDVRICEFGQFHVEVAANVGVQTGFNRVTKASAHATAQMRPFCKSVPLSKSEIEKNALRAAGLAELLGSYAEMRGEKGARSKMC